jgi:5-methylcytosine-specific restriction endonuclease McrA
MGDIESNAYLAGLPPGSLGSPALIPDLVSLMTRMISEHIQNFCEECNNNAGTTKILDADSRTELSLRALLRKYFST